MAHRPGKDDILHSDGTDDSLTDGDWVQTYSGRRFHLLNPRAVDVEPVDFTQALGETIIGGLMLTLLQETIIERVQKRRAERATSDAIQ